MKRVIDKAEKALQDRIFAVSGKVLASTINPAEHVTVMGVPATSRKNRRFFRSGDYISFRI